MDILFWGPERNRQCKPQDIDWKNDRIHVIQSKTEVPLTIPMHAALKIHDINWSKEIICIVQQKTNTPLKLPFCSLVGNAIYNYIIYESPRATGIKYIFLIEDRDVREISRHINHVCKKIMAVAGLSSSREKIGFHLFRQRFGVMLLDKGISAPVISAALGHTYPDSLNDYLDSDLVRLKICGISIEIFPIGKEMFK